MIFADDAELSEPESAGSNERPDDSVTILFTAAGTLVELTGEVDLAVDADLGLAADRAISADQPITLDVSRLTFIDSIGLAFVARLTAVDHQAGRRTTVVGASTGVRQLMAVSGLSDLVDFAE